MTVKELVEETFIADGNCSKQLGNLKAKGYVRSEKRGKESYYDMAEPLGVDQRCQEPFIDIWG